MPIRVEIEGRGQVAEFPDGTDQNIIDAAIRRDYFGQKETQGQRAAKYGEMLFALR
jgi:hypothetical protein